MAENLPAISSDVHYEVSLDPAPDDTPVAVGEVSVPAEPARLPIIPEWMQPDGFRYHVRRLGYGAAGHTMRLPEYVFWTVIWAVVGAGKVAWRRIHWWQLLEQERLRVEVAASGDSSRYLSLARHGQETRKVRSIIIAVCAGLVAIGCAVLVGKGYGWWLLSLLVFLPWLARKGRPADKPILRPVTVTHRFRLINTDIVLRAYYAAGLGHRDKPDMQVSFGSTMQRDGEGSRVLVDLPYGKSLKDAMLVKDSIASGLDVTESQVYLHRDPTSARRHTLWVADRDPLAVPVGRTPLLACRQTDIWKPAPTGLDERGQLVKVPLMWNSLLVGGLPRGGKTFTARQLALYCALDPYVKMYVFDGKGSPDWRKFALVAESCAFGLTPTKDGLPPEILLAALEKIKDEVQKRYHSLSELEAKNPAVCPEGKLTREIARDKRFGMPVIVVFLDEWQEYYDLGKISDPIAELLAFLVKVAPGAGVSIVASTQRPSGIGGSGSLQQRFTATRDNFQLRYSLRTSDFRVSEMVLGAGSYGEGLDSSKLLPQYKGVGILRGASDASPTVRAFLADGQDADKILTAARVLRERAGTLSGMAAGDGGQQVRDVLADVLAVFAGETGLQWAELAGRLAKQFPDRWAGVTADAISAQVRDLEVPGSQVWGGGANAQGCKRMDVENRVAR